MSLSTVPEEILLHILGYLHDVNELGIRQQRRQIGFLSKKFDRIFVRKVQSTPLRLEDFSCEDFCRRSHTNLSVSDIAKFSIYPWLCIHGAKIGSITFDCPTEVHMATIMYVLRCCDTRQLEEMTVHDEIFPRLVDCTPPVEVQHLIPVAVDEIKRVFSAKLTGLKKLSWTSIHQNGILRPGVIHRFANSLEDLDVTISSKGDFLAELEKTIPSVMRLKRLRIHLEIDCDIKISSSSLETIQVFPNFNIATVSECICPQLAMFEYKKKAVFATQSNMVSHTELFGESLAHGFHPVCYSSRSRSFLGLEVPDYCNIRLVTIWSEERGYYKDDYSMDCYDVIPCLGDISIGWKDFPPLSIDVNHMHIPRKYPHQECHRQNIEKDLQRSGAFHYHGHMSMRSYLRHPQNGSFPIHKGHLLGESHITPDNEVDESNTQSDWIATDDGDGGKEGDCDCFFQGLSSHLFSFFHRKTNLIV